MTSGVIWLFCLLYTIFLHLFGMNLISMPISMWVGHYTKFDRKKQSQTKAETSETSEKNTTRIFHD